MVIDYKGFLNAPADKDQARPLTVWAYLSVWATGGAVASPPYREGPWGGWMSLSYFLCARES